jgi:putative oxidoreductase
MNDRDAVDLALLVLRCGVGAVMFAHGWNHVFGGGKIAGTAKWFGSMGMRPPCSTPGSRASRDRCRRGARARVLTPFGAAGVIGVMASRGDQPSWNGFFIFRPGEDGST